MSDTDPVHSHRKRPSAPLSSSRFYVVSLLVFLFAGTPGLLLAASQQELRVGVYNNPPKIVLNDEQQLSGIHGELLRAIAAEEDWRLQAVPCAWQRCLEMLADGRIDIMPDVASTPERLARFDLHNTPALLSWSQIYQQREQRLASLLDLSGRTVAVLKDSVQQNYLQSLAASFDLDVSWVLVDALDEGFAAVGEGRADAVAANVFYGDRAARKAGLLPAPIQFQPAKLYFAVPAGKHAEVLAAIDKHLEAWRKDGESPYFRILHRWSVEQTWQIPAAAWLGFVALLTAFVLALIFNQLLRRRVAQQTASLRDSERRLNTILNSVDASIYIKDRNLRYEYINQKGCELLDRPREQVLGRRDEDFFDEETVATFRSNDRRVLEQGERVADEEMSTQHDEGTTRTLFSIKLPLSNEHNEIYALCGISTDITEYREIQKRLDRLSFYDPLTGLPNRRLLLDRLHYAMAGMARTGYDGALLLIDIDGFKNVNDSLGHDFGDELLRQISGRLQSELGDSDTAARLSADEFGIILSDLSTVTERAFLASRRYAESLSERLSEPYVLNGQGYKTSVSIGIILFSDARGDASSLLKGADLAMHAAKDSGRQAMRFFNPVMQTELTRRNQIETALRQALEANELNLHVQPQIDSTGHFIGMEALLRWEDAELGTMSPGDFIPIAEASGLIVPIGEWVLDRACALLAHWQTLAGMRELSLSVNLSPRQFRDANLGDHLRHCLRQHEIDASKLELEVTESLLIDDLETTAERMHRLRRHGIRFSLDDFGTGYASLGYLKRLPLGQLKIDQSFVADLLTDPNDEAIVRTIIALGQSLDMQVIAEGVETPEQAQRLRDMGCDAMQGYYFGRPEPAKYWQEQLATPRALPE